MSFDKYHPNRKDQRKPFRGSTALARSCRPNGSCDWCRSNRQHANEKREAAANDRQEMERDE